MSAPPSDEELRSFPSGSSQQRDGPRSAAVKPWHSDPLPESQQPDESVKRSRSNSGSRIYDFLPVNVYKDSEDRILRTYEKSIKEIAEGQRLVADVLNELYKPLPPVERNQEQQGRWERVVKLYKEVSSTCGVILRWLDIVAENVHARRAAIRVVVQLEDVESDLGRWAMVEILLTSLDVNPKYDADMYRIKANMEEARKYNVDLEEHVKSACKAAKDYIVAARENDSTDMSHSLEDFQAFIQDASIAMESFHEHLGIAEETISKVEKKVSTIRKIHWGAKYGSILAIAGLSGGGLYKACKALR